MRQFLALILSVGGVAVFAQTPSEEHAQNGGQCETVPQTFGGARRTLCASDSLETAANKRIAAAEQALQRTRDLVEAGAVARVRLEQAEEDLDDARDQAVLDRTLYGATAASDWTGQLTEQMLAAAQRQVDRQQQRIETARRLVVGGVAVPMYLTPFEAELTTRQLTLDLARSRARLMNETAALAKFEQAIAETADAAPEENDGVLASTGMEHYEGDGAFDESRELPPLELAFAAKFDRALPVSAEGETDLHRGLGFDHRGRVDVALNPGDSEGIWLRHYLKSRKIPYYAFTHAFPGRATAAHIHIGPGSTRLRTSD